MSNKELDFELIDESADGQGENEFETNEDTTPSDKKSKEGSEEATSSAKGNKSNFKKISKLNKALISENRKLKEKLLGNKSEINEEFNDDFEDELDEVLFDKTEFRFFLIDNPEAKELSKEIEEISKNNPNLNFEDAFALAKAKKPKISVSHDDFNTRSVNTKVRKRLQDLTNEEALKLPNDKYLEYKRLKGAKI